MFVDKYAPIKQIIQREHHTFFGGASGSGKSVLENSTLYTMLLDSPYQNLFVLIDTKGVEVSLFKDAPHCVKYVNDPDEVYPTLQGVIRVMEARKTRMEEKGLRKSDEPNLWVVIDEWFDIKTICDKRCIKQLELLSARSRAFNIYILASSQRCTKDVLSGVVATNFSCRVGLKTINAQDSRNLIFKKGCETLPRYGKGIMLIDSDYSEIDIPLTTDEEIIERVNYWRANFKFEQG